MTEEIKTISIDENQFRICKLSARAGSWLLMHLMGKLVEIMENKKDTSEPEPVEQPSQDDAAKAAIKYMLMNLDETLFTKVQTHALSVCYRLETAGGVPIPMPVISGDGRFAIKELETDIETVTTLTNESLIANLGPYFSKNVLVKLMQG